MGFSMVHSARRRIEGKSGCSNGEPFRVVDAVYFRVARVASFAPAKAKGFLLETGIEG